jgi:hypothetical protein
MPRSGVQPDLAGRTAQVEDACAGPVHLLDGRGGLLLLPGHHIEAVEDGVDARQRALAHFA